MKREDLDPELLAKLEAVKGRRAKLCKSCYWASPERYTHIALQQIRRVEIVWSGEEVSRYGAIAKAARRRHLPIQSFIKTLLNATE
jgi:hypothetical protein